MLLPKFSIKQLFLLMIAFALISALFGARSSLVASGLGVALFLTVIPFLCYAVVHWLAVLIAMVLPKPRGLEGFNEPAAIAGGQAVLAEVVAAVPQVDTAADAAAPEGDTTL